jgi:hypothetical protein
MDENKLENNKFVSFILKEYNFSKLKLDAAVGVIDK